MKSLLYFAELYIILSSQIMHANNEVSLEDSMTKSHFVVYGAIKSFEYEFFLREKKLVKTMP
jgi:hypothetical protein